MLHSLAKYIWGSGCDSEQSKTEQEPGTADHLETQHEEDWVLVKTAEDKENTGLYSDQACHHHHLAHQSQSPVPGRCDRLSQNSGTSDVEILDDAAALAQSMSAGDLDHHVLQTCSGCNFCPLHDCGWVNQDTDKYSDTESLPESVFSACSGRSHATYHPHGSQSEPWVVAPPPCFTGSHVGESSPIASSPLENLLIEHPSMSVYLSLPCPGPFISARSASETETGSIQEEAAPSCQVELERSDSSGHQFIGDEVVLDEGNQNETNTIQQRNIHVRAAVHPGPVLSQQLLKNVRLSQRLESRKSWKLMSRCQCGRQNKVRDYQTHVKGSNRRNKLTRPSGFMSSRYHHHM